MIDERDLVGLHRGGDLVDFAEAQIGRRANLLKRDDFCCDHIEIDGLREPLGLGDSGLVRTEAETFEPETRRCAEAMRCRRSSR